MMRPVTRTMRTLRSGALVASVVMAAAAGSGCGIDSPLPQDEDRRVLAVEDEYVAAEINRDEAALRRLVDERFVMNSTNGTTSDKEALIRSVLAMNMAGQTITERTVTVEGDVAIVSGTAEIRLAAPGGDEQVSLLRYTSVYLKRQDEWRMLALHMSPRAREP
jgi:ketosteroid isomerase-like protein